MENHDSNSIPIFNEAWDPGDNDWVWIGWADVLDGAAIATSTWTLPTGWTNHAELTNQTTQDPDDVSYTNCNGVRTSNSSATAGLYTFTNVVTLTDSRSYSRSVKVRVKDL